MFVQKRITEIDWKVVGLGGQRYETIMNPTMNSNRDNSDSIGEICKKELQILLPVVVYDKIFRTLIFKVVEDLKKIQANEAQDNAQAIVAVWAHFRIRPFPAFPASGQFRPVGS